MLHEKYVFRQQTQCNCCKRRYCRGFLSLGRNSYKCTRIAHRSNFGLVTISAEMYENRALDHLSNCLEFFDLWKRTLVAELLFMQGIINT